MKYLMYYITMNIHIKLKKTKLVIYTFVNKIRKILV